MPDENQLLLLEDCLNKGATAIDLCHFLLKIVPNGLQLLSKDDKTKEDILGKLNSRLLTILDSNLHQRQQADLQNYRNRLSTLPGSSATATCVPA
jgi:hypothetical protein